MITRFFRPSSKRFGLRVAFPATLVLVGTLATVVYSLSEMAGEANRIEDALVSRSASGAIKSFVRHIGDSHTDYARWDDAVHSLYGTISQDFVVQNFVASTETPTFFDTAYLLDESGRDAFGFHDGKATAISSEVAFGSVLRTMIARLPRDGRTYGLETGLVQTAWGLAAVAAGPVVPNTPDFPNPPPRSRMLVLAKRLDGTAIHRLGEDFVIDGLRLEDVASLHSIPLFDPSGGVIGHLAWTPRHLGSQANAQVSPTVFVMLGLLVVTMGVLIFVAMRGIREIRRREEQSRHAATHDDLTGLPNRSALIHGLDAAIENKRQTNAPCVLVYLDLDGFKEVNDAYGHETGDRLLQQVAARFQSLSDDNLLARLGGDEFALLVTGTEAKRVASIFGRNAIDLLKLPFNIDGRPIFVGTSLGVAVADELDLSAEELLRRADVAMYHAKQQGPNHTFVYDSVVDAARHERIAIANDLRRAIGTDELTVVYQPVFDGREHKIVAAEALLRWTRPTSGPMPPSAFIPIAEETGLIDSLGAWALRRACTDALAWPDIRLSVNVSPAQFRNPNFVATVSDTLRETGFPTERLEVEVTETYFITQPEQARTTMEALRGIGVSLALDDFGTGYSSIGYLRRFRFDMLKLDRSMILNIASDRSVQRLVQATVALADALGLSVTAEGVETEEEAVLLRAAGCREFQGFLFAKPCSPEQFATRLAVNDIAAQIPVALTA